MSSVLKISEAASLALHSMALLAEDPEQLISTREIASRLHISEAHLSKVLQRLTRAGLAKSVRGPKGGFMVNKPTDQITLLDVYESIEGPIEPTDCLFSTPVCDKVGCILGGILGKVDKQIRAYLLETKLSDLANRKRRA